MGPPRSARPYFIGGTLVAAIALILMPSSHELWMAASLLWMLDAAVNVSMEPFRAFVGDLLPEKQRKVGYAMQSVLIGAGAVISSALPWILKQFGVSDAAAPGTIPDTVRYAFISGAIVYVLAVTYTVVTTREYPPENMDELRREQARARNPFAAFVDIVKGVGSMPRTMIELAFVQFFTWIALFLMWIYFGVGVAKHIFNAPTGTPEYEQASAWAGVCFSVYNGVAFVFAFALLGLTRVFSAKAIHTVCLLLGALGLASYGLSMLGVPFSKNALLIPMVGVGIAWASILSMPYAMLSSALPREKMGFYMGVFNFFIVLPQILAAVAFGPLMKAALNDNALSAIVIGGGCMALAAVATLFVKDARQHRPPDRPSNLSPKTKKPCKRRAFSSKWSGGESNSRPHHCERCALPTELPPQHAGRGLLARGGFYPAPARLSRRRAPEVNSRPTGLQRPLGTRANPEPPSVGGVHY